MKQHQYINQDSGNFEWYTPIDIVERARKTMGSIDLDPFSSEVANKRVGANQYYDCNGFENEWFGNVWVNHPFSKENNQRIFNKISKEYFDGRIKQACVITFASTSEKWFKGFLDSPICFIYGRTNYFLPNGEKKSGVTKGSCVTYFGDNIESFIENFSEIGKVKI